MKKFLFLIVISLLLSCSSGDSVEPEATSVSIEATSHTSEGLHYSNLNIQLSIPGSFSLNEQLPLNEIEEITWTLNGEIFSERDEPELLLKEPGIYDVTAKGSGTFYHGTFTVRREFEAHREFEVVEAPYSYGSIDANENVDIAWPNEFGSISIILDIDGYDQYVLIWNDNLDEELVSFHPGYYYSAYELGRTFSDSNSSLVFPMDQSIVTINGRGELVNRVFTRAEIHDMKLTGGDQIEVLRDSSSQLFLTSIDRLNDSYSSTPLALSFEDNYELSSIYFGGPSTYLAFLADYSGYENNLLTASTYSGDHLFSLPLEGLHINKLWTVSDGYIFTSPSPIDDLRQLTKISFEGEVEWSFDLYFYNSDEFSYSYGAEIEIIEKDQHVYIFHDNMRCRKVSLEGNIIWDKFYYYKESVLRTVVEKDNNFYMIGSRQYNPITKDGSGNANQRDLIALSIDVDGNIVN